ncbi:hypothetical protein Daesc_006532 [Daldinia eschscholtzii]|uniref:DUF6594 domain-containing protein n=1 Tax=Daldinia eschscholtzii TaxID=292717 RepID=A0AAX6MHS9_9PEZI
MATPTRLEEGHGVGSSHQETEDNQQYPRATSQQETTSGNGGAHQDSLESQLHSDFDLKKEAPKGWPYIAAAQLYYPNFNIHRRFAYLLHRALIDQETKLAYLEDQLKALDKEDENQNAPRLRSLPFDPDTLLSNRTQPRPPSIRQTTTTSRGDNEQQAVKEEYSRWKDKDLIFEAFIPRLKNYYELLQLDKEMQRLPAISRKEHMAFYTDMIGYNRLDRPAYTFLLSRDDFVTTVTDRVHQYFEALIYKSAPIVSVSTPFLLVADKLVSTDAQRHLKFLNRIFRRTQQSDSQDTSPEIELSNLALIVFFKILVIFGSGVLLLSPVAILFLVDLPRDKSFGVVVAFIFAFVFVLACFNSNWDTILVGLSAYMAVLATFLSNLEQGRTQIS